LTFLVTCLKITGLVATTTRNDTHDDRVYVEPLRE